MKGRSLLTALLAAVLAAGCDRPFQPIQKNEGAAFSMFGYLDLYADTQWVRVMPVRQNLLLAREPIDAVVTLQHVASGRTVTLKDSLFTFVDERLGGAAYAHNFWTTERLQPRASYRLTATRSDGTATTALVTMPEEITINFRNDVQTPRSELGHFYVPAERIVFVDVLYLMLNSCGAASAVYTPHTVHQRNMLGSNFLVRGDSIGPECLYDIRRQEIRVTIAPTGWPYDRTVTDLEVGLPGRIPSNVENGLGFVGGVATRTIPFHRCEIVVPAADRTRTCEYVYNARSATITGRVLRQPCGRPHPVADIRLREKFTDGRTVIRSWKTGAEGEYRFDGIEPGAQLVLELPPGTSVVSLPLLTPGQRYVVPDLSTSGGC